MTEQNGQGSAAPRPGVSPLTAALVSLLVPGGGQFLLGRRQRGLGFFLAIAILGALILALGAVALLAPVRTRLQFRLEPALAALLKPITALAISPDGKLIAYTFVSYECPIGVECGARAATGYTAADHLTPADRYGSTYFSNPSWVGNNRTIQSGGYGSQINFHDLGQGDPVHWFDDSDYASPSTDLDDGELSTDGSRFAAIRGYGDSAHIIWYSVTGNARTGTPPTHPEAMCVTGELKGIAGPTFSPDGHSLAWAEPDGIWTKPDLDTCGSPQPALTIPGGSEPDWGPAAVDPGPLLKFAVKPVKASLGKVLKKGLRMKVTTPAAGRVNAKVKLGSKTVATGSARAAAAGKTVVTARFNSGARKSIAKRKTVRMTLNVTFGSQKAKLGLGF